MNQTIEHYANIEPSAKTWQVYLDQKLILESDRALELKEHYDGRDFPAVIYFPALDALEVSANSHTTHCPIKGDASYWNYQNIENAIWAYRTPVDSASAIANHYAFSESAGFVIKPKG